MTELNIFLPDDLQEFIDRQLATGDYDTVDDYINHLLRQERERVAGKQINPVITEELFNKVIKCIERFCKKTLEPENTQMVLTEADLQAWIFHYLLSELGEKTVRFARINSNRIGIHCNAYFLDNNDALRVVPDIILLDKQTYSVDPSGGLYKRKGYTFWGSSIVIEIKLFRANYNETKELKKWKEDIDQLVAIKARHYSSYNREKFFPAFVLLAKKAISMTSLEIIKDYAIRNNVKLILFCKSL